MKNRIRNIKSKRDVIFWDTSNNHCSDLDEEIEFLLASHQPNIWNETVDVLKSMCKKEFNEWREVDEYKSSLLYA
ncbi:MAG TPA: hypothetical protein ENI61_01085 [Ignavibacteria bacterium]|nr:hypothetical protein [Ignavibacteria bacterium]